LRVASLLGLGILLYFLGEDESIGSGLTIIFVLITIFSLSGALASISYTDILGKSLLETKRKTFFSIRQILMGLGVFASALLAAKLLNSFNYPINYSALFIVAGISLSIATLGFLRVKEVRSQLVKLNSIKEYLLTLKNEIKTNSRLRGYLLLVNTLGISLTLLPFLTLYSKQYFNISNEQIGEYLIFKVTAAVLAGLLVYKFSKLIKYKHMLYGIAILVSLVPLHLLSFGSQQIYIIYFFIGGMVFTFYKVALEGILLEISTNENRAIYAGLAGAGHLLPALFPIIGGWIIYSFGFGPFFTVFILVILVSFYFIYHLDCKK
jgi:MFS family permease